jgi:hypothetical protein
VPAPKKEAARLKQKNADRIELQESGDDQIASDLTGFVWKGCGKKIDVKNKANFKRLCCLLGHIGDRAFQGHPLFSCPGELS